MHHIALPSSVITTVTTVLGLRSFNVDKKSSTTSMVSWLVMHHPTVTPAMHHRVHTVTNDISGCAITDVDTGHVLLEIENFLQIAEEMKTKKILSTRTDSLLCDSQSSKAFISAVYSPMTSCLALFKLTFTISIGYHSCHEAESVLSGTMR